MTVKMLRHYHQTGLLEPADVNPHTGYRRYTAEQIPAAQVIRRLRGLDMPLEEIQAVLAAPDVQTRSEQITSHLSRLEGDLARRQRAVASLRDLLAPASPGAPAVVEVRSVPAVPAAAITEVVDVRGLCCPGYQGALGETLRGDSDRAGPGRAAGPAGGRLRRPSLFSQAAGGGDDLRPLPRPQVRRPVGRVAPLGGAGGRAGGSCTPRRGLATPTPTASYGALAAYVARPRPRRSTGPIPGVLPPAPASATPPTRAPDGAPRSAGRSSRSVRARKKRVPNRWIRCCAGGGRVGPAGCAGP